MGKAEASDTCVFSQSSRPRYVYLASVKIRLGPKLKSQTTERVFNAVVEKDEDGYFVASVIELPGCHTQAGSLDELRGRVREAIEAYLQVTKPTKVPEFVGVQQLKVRFSGK